MSDKVNILLVDDQPSKLLTYEIILSDLEDNLIKATSGREALEQLLKNEIAVVLMDVCMPELDGFELASMIREHPRFQKIAMIFISAIHLAEIDHLRGYEMGAVDYVPVPVVPEVLRAKVRVFADLYRKSRQLEHLNLELEQRVTERTAELEASTARLLESEQRRSLALAAGSMGSWDWDLARNEIKWDDGQYAIYGVAEQQFAVTPANLKALVLPEDWDKFQAGWEMMLEEGRPHQAEYRIRRPNGEIRWCASVAATSRDQTGKVIRISGVTMDITERKCAEERQALLAREVDHRAKNAMAIVQSIVRLTKTAEKADYTKAIEGRINALSRVHMILSDARWQGADIVKLINDELAPYQSEDGKRIKMEGRNTVLNPTIAQTLALVLHELATNAAKYGALSNPDGTLSINWELSAGEIRIGWKERGGPPVGSSRKKGFGTRIITSSVEAQLGGKATFDWLSEGLSCSFHVPYKSAIDTSRVATEEAPRGHVSKSINARQILIVEDEALVAMALQDQLEALGLSVLATCANVPDALAAINSRLPDAAILDVNLGGQFVYPVADRLTELGIPHVFVTGYGRESIDRRYWATRTLEKPLDGDVLEQVFARPPKVEAAFKIRAAT